MPTPTHQKKLRPGKLSQLPPEARAALDARLRGQQDTLEGIAAWLEAEHGVTISPQALSMYYRRRVLPEKWRHMEAIAAELNRVGGEHVAAAAGQAVAQKVFEWATDEQADPKLLATFYKLMLDTQAQQMDARKLAMLERKAAAADAAEAAAQDSALTPEERVQRIREIFGMV